VRVAFQRDAITGETATVPTGGGGRAVSGPRSPLGLRGAAIAHASSANIDVAARGGRPGRHVPAAGNLTATTDKESYHGSSSELPPATSHEYEEWDFSGVPNPVMFQRFLDPRTTSLAAPTTLAPGATTPRGNASSCLPTTKQTPRTRRKLTTCDTLKFHH
jgi:hypothetical protein